MATNCGWTQHGLKHLLSIFWDYNIFESFIFLRKSCVCDKDTQCASLRDVISVQRLADVANIWERLPRNSDHKLHTPEYWVIFEGGGSTIDPAIIWYLASFKKKRRRKNSILFCGCVRWVRVTQLIIKYFVNLEKSGHSPQLGLKFSQRREASNCPLSVEFKLGRGC